jgi:predicted transcriptional regulator
MSVPCEVAVKCVLPVVRAMVARQLKDNNDLKQVDVAKLLKVSQPAISLYQRNMRGKAIDLENDEEIQRLVSKMAESLVKGKLAHSDLILTYCQICRTIRAKGLLCKLHEAFDSTIDADTCGICKSIENSCFQTEPRVENPKPAKS